ncbi:MAG: HD domain-containing phosphohydrolase [Eubacterium sp.]|nr:HD domain-containing phosphohydrolase [Eubacterium sp.]
MNHTFIAILIIISLLFVAATLVYSNEKLKKEREHSRKLTNQLVEAIVGAIDAKDIYTQGHSIRVALYSRELARRAGKSTEFQRNIYYLGMVHDVGKIGVHGAILRKTGELTEEEYEEIRKHPTMGGEILSGISEIPRIRVGALYHHERYDGTGYPFGLKGDSIPEEGRIIAVADTYDAMASNRSYRAAMPQEEIRKVIKENAGKQLDPYYAGLMLDIIDDDKNYVLRGQAVASKDSIDNIRFFLSEKARSEREVAK